MSKLGKTLKNRAKKAEKPKSPIWKGPIEDGITQSMLGAFLVCRERFRLRYMEGLTEPDVFNHRIEYGQMWHTCEEEYARTGGDNWIWALLEYVKKLCKKYKQSQEQILHWHNVCKVQFEVYLKYQKKRQPKDKKKVVYQEKVFSEKYRLPSGRVVTLRGKWDEVFEVGRGELWLKEHKTKGNINEQQLVRQLTFDLQTMFYLVALGQEQGRKPEGVLYNVVRRPLSGGVGSIRKTKQKVYRTKSGQVTKRVPEETDEHFYKRVKGIIEENPEYFFMQWDVNITTKDIENFKRRFLTPILEQLCDWWEDQIEGMLSKNHSHWRHPYGVWNPMDQGGTSELDEYLATGSLVGLERQKKLFEELKAH